jgi:hypothetical protein
MEPAVPYGQTAGWTDMAELTVAFRSFVKAHKNEDDISFICTHTVYGTHPVRFLLFEPVIYNQPPSRTRQNIVNGEAVLRCFDSQFCLWLQFVPHREHRLVKL